MLQFFTFSQFKVVQTAVETWEMLLARENLLHIPTRPKCNRGLTIHKDSKPRSELTSTYQPASALLGRGRPVDISVPQCACITFIKANKWRFKVKWRQQKVSTITWVWYDVYSPVGTLQLPVISKCLSRSQRLVQKSTICWDDQTSISRAPSIYQITTVTCQLFLTAAAKHACMSRCCTD